MGTNSPSLYRKDLRNISDVSNRVSDLILDFVLSGITITHGVIDFLASSASLSGDGKFIPVNTHLFIKIALDAANYVKEMGGTKYAMKLAAVSVLEYRECIKKENIEFRTEFMAESVAVHAMSVSYPKEELESISKRLDHATNLIIDFALSDMLVTDENIDFLAGSLFLNNFPYVSKHDRSFIKMAFKTASYVKEKGGNKSSMKLATLSILDSCKSGKHKGLELTEEQIMIVSNSVAETVMHSVY